MDNEPSSSVKVLIGDSLGLTVELEPEVARRENVQSGGGSVLDNEG